MSYSTCSSIESIDLLEATMGEPTAGDVQQKDALSNTRAATPSEVEARTDVTIEVPQVETSVVGNGGDYRYHRRSAPYHRLEHPIDKSLFVSFIGSITFLIFSILLLCPGIVFYVLFLPLGFIIKRCAAICCCCSANRVCIACCNQYMSQNDAFWLQDDPVNVAVYHAMFTVEKGLDINRIKDLISTKLINAEGTNRQKLYPHFTQRVHTLFSGYAWVTDAEFSIDNHVQMMPDKVRDEQSLQTHLGLLSGQSLTMDKPLWEVHVKSHFGHDDDTVILLRIHPCVSDGISLVRLFLKSFVYDIHDQANFNLKPRFGRVAFAFNCMRAIFIGPIVFMQKWLFFWKDHNLLHGPCLSGNKVVAWSEAYSMVKATRIKDVTRSTLNDILLTVATGSIRTYCQKHGIAHPYDINTFIPVDFRTDHPHSISMGNQFALVDIKLPTNTEGAIPRLWEVKHRMDNLKNSADPVVLYSCLWTLAYLLPQFLYHKLWCRIFSKSTCFVTSLEGPPAEVDVLLHQVKAMVTWMPARDNVALSLSFITYADQLRMTVIADSAIVTKPDILTKDFITQMDILSQLLANRRIPGEHIHRNEGSIHEEGLGVIDDTSIEEIQSKMRDVQQQLQELKSRLDIEAQEQYSMEERNLVSKVEQLKEEFRELLTELRRKKTSDGSVLSDEEDEEDGELRRSVYRRRSTSGVSRRSVSSIASTQRPLTTASQRHHIPPSSPPPIPTSSSTPSSPTHLTSETSMVFNENRNSSEKSAIGQQSFDSYSPQVERKC